MTNPVKQADAPALSLQTARAVRWGTAMLAAATLAAAFWLVTPALGPGHSLLRKSLIGVAIVLAALRFVRIGWAARGLAIALALAASLGLAELGLRLFWSRPLTTLIQPDDRWLYKLVPGASRSYTHTPTNGGGSVLIEVNHAGFRGKDLPRDAKKRVVVYGDSYIEGEFSPLEATFPAQLEARLRGPHVINAGVVGYGPDQVSARMADELPGLGVDLAIVAIYSGNDFGDLLRNKMLRLDDAGHVVDNPWVMGKAMKGAFAESRSGLFLLKLLSKGASRKVVTPIVAPRMDKALEMAQSEYDEYIVRGDNQIRNLLFDPYNADVALKPDSPSAKYRVRLMEGAILRMKETAERSHVPLVLVIIPDPFDVCDVYDGYHFDPVEYPEYKRSRLTDLLEDIATRADLQHVNLFEPFRRGDPTKLYFRGGNNHWNDAGQGLAAEVVGDYLLRKGLVKGP